MYKCFLFAVGIFCVLSIKAQNPFSFTFRNTTFASDNEQLPFWFTANRNGKIYPKESLLNISEIYIGQSNHSDTSSLKWSWGSDIVAGRGNENYFQLNQLFAALLYKNWELKGGSYHDSLRFSGLSSTNGNIIRSVNARPFPMLRLSSAKNIPVPLTKGLFSFNVLYSEGFLNDHRFVNKVRLHQKSFHLMANPAPLWEISVGFEHSVMWGGFSMNNQIGQMPEDLHSYLRYILGSRGSNAFPESDKMNVAGNQLGTWQIEIEKVFTNVKSTFYLNHPFEDFSGVNLRNWPDNLIGLHIHFNTGRFINAFLYEYTNTRQQSIRDSLYAWDEESGRWSSNEFDNYFNHGIYQSGYTYQGQVIGSPLFFPGDIEEGISKGIKSNRFFAHHAGITGNITRHLKWKGMITYVKHYGIYTKPYASSITRVSGLLELFYSNLNLPVELCLSAAADSSPLSNINKGISLSLAKKW